MNSKTEYLVLKTTSVQIVLLTYIIIIIIIIILDLSS